MEEEMDYCERITSLKLKVIFLFFIIFLKVMLLD